MLNLQQEASETTNALLNAIQWSFPLVERPFESLAAELELTENAVIDLLEEQTEKGVIRQLSAIFDTRALGYSSSLVATKIPEANLEAGAAAISAHPGVSHNYKRNHEFNVWYTLAVPPGHLLKNHSDALHRLSGAVATRLLPTEKLFKIGVRLDMTGEKSARATKPVAPDADAGTTANNEPARPPGEPPSQERRTSTALTARDEEVVRLTQEPLPLVSRPFQSLATNSELSESGILDALTRFHEKKIMRRFAAVLNHRAAGFKANAMGVWAVPPEKIQTLGPIMASFEAVSHCYQRPTYKDWPFSVFTMIHGRTRSDIDATVQAIEQETGIGQFDLLWSIREYKKVRLRFFTPEWQYWCQENLRG